MIVKSFTKMSWLVVIQPVIFQNLAIFYFYIIKKRASPILGEARSMSLRFLTIYQEK